MPNHSEIKSGTLRAICTQLGISREMRFSAIFTTNLYTFNLSIPQIIQAVMVAYKQLK